MVQRVKRTLSFCSDRADKTRAVRGSKKLTTKAGSTHLIICHRGRPHKSFRTISSQFPRLREFNRHVIPWEEWNSNSNVLRNSAVTCLALVGNKLRTCHESLSSLWTTVSNQGGQKGIKYFPIYHIWLFIIFSILPFDFRWSKSPSLPTVVCWQVCSRCHGTSKKPRKGYFSWKCIWWDSGDHSVSAPTSHSENEVEERKKENQDDADVVKRRQLSSIREKRFF
jgi:hypothetical protein